MTVEHITDQSNCEGRPFIHLRTRTAYSLSEGAITPGACVNLCLQNAIPALGVTDSNNLFGALEISTKLASAGVQPIIGCTLSIDLGRSRSDRIQSRKSARGDEHAYRPLALLSKTRNGFENLMQLSSEAYVKGKESGVPHVSIADLRRWQGGLLALTGGRLGALDYLLKSRGPDHAAEFLKQIEPLFEGHLYIEVQRHLDGVSDETEEHLLGFAYDRDLPLVATNEPFFSTREMADAHDALLCIADGAYLNQADRRRLTPEHYFKSAAEMNALFADLPEALEATAEIAQRCSYMPETRDPILPSFGSGADEAQELRRQAEAGLKDRLASGIGLAAPEADYWDRLQHELDIIIRMEFPGYFLIVADFIKWSKANDIPVGPGRGSGAGSIVAWALTITDLDPLRFALLFERFLNPERVSMPDFDIDFCQDRRDEVIHYVQEKYGHDRVAQIITFGKLQARAVVRDVGRVMSLPYGQVDRISKLIPSDPANPTSLGEAVEQVPELRAEMEQDDTIDNLITTALKLEGLYRHASTHAAGLVIGDRPLEELIPLYRDPRSNMPVTQYNLNWVEPAGLVKFDFLGLKTLTVLQKACELLKRSGVQVNLEHIPFDDEKTYQMLSAGDTIGVFQFESSGMQDLLRQAGPTNFEDLIALVALFRPGPMENIPKYLACKHGDEDPEFLHESLSQVVADTYGVIIYQEQVMQIAQILSGYSLGEADLLRRAMGKKKKEEMDRQKDRFVRGALENGVDQDRAEYIFELVGKFAGYGFNKSHSAAYALLAYQTAYLKANYPVEFLAALMCYDKSNTDKLQIICQEAVRNEIELVPPDINASETDFTTQDGKIVYALSAIKNVGTTAVSQIVNERHSSGPYTDLFDFARRLDTTSANRRLIENLAKAGALDSVWPHRAQSFAEADFLLQYADHQRRERESSQSNLFGEAAVDLPTPDLPKHPRWTSIDQLDKEKEAIGFFLSGHPLETYQTVLEQEGVLTFKALSSSPNHDTRIVKLAGAVVYARTRPSRNSDKPITFVALSDASDSYELIAFSDVVETHRDLLEPGTLVMTTAAVRWEEGAPKLSAKSFRRLDDVDGEAAHGLRVFVQSPEAIEDIRVGLEQARQASRSERCGPVHLIVLAAETDPQTACSDTGKETSDPSPRQRYEIEITLGQSFPVHSRVKSALKALPGVIDVQQLKRSLNASGSIAGP